MERRLEEISLGCPACKEGNKSGRWKEGMMEGCKAALLCIRSATGQACRRRPRSYCLPQRKGVSQIWWSEDLGKEQVCVCGFVVHGLLVPGLDLDLDCTGWTGWLANPQGFLRRQKLSGFRGRGRCGTLLAGDSREWPCHPLPSPGPPVDTQLQRPMQGPH